MCEAKAHVCIISLKPGTQLQDSKVGECPMLFYKMVAKLCELSYVQRLRKLNLLSLKHSKQLADLFLLHRCPHGKCDNKLLDIDLLLSLNNEKNAKTRLT